MQSPFCLPDPEPMSDAIFSWGTLDASAFIDLISSAYTEIVHWKRNVFLVPHGRAGIDFVLELTRLFTAYGEASALESIALKAAFVCCGLLLQLPHRRSKPREQLACLERRLSLWKDGLIDELLLEGRTIQNRLPGSRRTKNSSKCTANRSWTFANLMFRGKVREAIYQFAI